MENSAPPAVAWPLAAVDSQRPEDPLLDCLILTRLHQRPKSAQALTAGLPLQDGCLTPALFARSAARAGINARLVRRPLEAINAALLPVVLLLHERRAVVLLGWQADGAARIADPDTGMGEDIRPRQQLLDQYTGSALLVRPAPVFDERSADHGAPHSGHWFWGTLRNLWPIYGEVLLAAFLVNVFALALPLFTMNVYNRVVPNRAVETLWVLAIGVAVVALFDLLMRSLRAYFLTLPARNSTWRCRHACSSR